MECKVTFCHKPKLNSIFPVWKLPISHFFCSYNYIILHNCSYLQILFFLIVEIKSPDLNNRILLLSLLWNAECRSLFSIKTSRRVKENTRTKQISQISQIRYYCFLLDTIRY